MAQQQEERSRQFSGPEPILKLMKEFYAEYSAGKLASELNDSNFWSWINWKAWASAILNGEFSTLTETYYHKFCEELTETLPEDKLREIYKKFKKNGRIMHADIVKKFKEFEQNRTGVSKQPTINAKMSKDLIVHLLAYTFIVEAPCDDYVDRMCNYFEW